MKRAFLLFGLVAAFASCKKEEIPMAYKIRYVVEGNGIEKVEYNVANTYRSKSSATNGFDTTFSQNLRQKLELRAKAKSGSTGVLSGYIYLNDKQVGKVVDEGPDANGYYEVKVEYNI